MHVYGRGGHSNQIAMMARGCNEKHENNLGKASSTSLEHDDHKLSIRKIVIWFSGKIVGLSSEVGFKSHKKFCFLYLTFHQDFKAGI